jgi:hypothetical protein
MSFRYSEPELTLVTLSRVGYLIASKFSNFSPIDKGTIIDGETKRSSIIDVDDEKDAESAKPCAAKILRFPPTKHYNTGSNTRKLP